MNKPPDRPETLDDYLWYVRHHENSIFVREKNDSGKWDTVALSELGPEQWAKHVARWIERGHIPVRILTDEEIEERRQHESDKKVDV